MNIHRLKCQSQPNETDRLNSTLFNGLIKNAYATGGYCDCRTINRDFDPKNFQIKSPILYINGEFDPATPLNIAQSHFNTQSSSPQKSFILVKDGGHFSTWRELATCTDEIFGAGFSVDFSTLSRRQDYSKGCQKNRLIPEIDLPSVR